jgi:hypothetical protein
MMKRIPALIACLLVALIIDVRATAEPLQPFTVRDLSGALVASETLHREGPWVLVYVTPACVPCNSLLDRLENEAAVLSEERLVIVVGRATSAQAETLRAASPQLHHVRWLVDSANEAAAALRTGGAPVSVGCMNGNSEWTLKGAVAVTHDAITSWLARVQ